MTFPNWATIIGPCVAGLVYLGGMVVIILFSGAKGHGKAINLRNKKYDEIIPSAHTWDNVKASLLTLENTRKIMADLGMDGTVLDPPGQHGMVPHDVFKAHGIPKEKFVKCTLLQHGSEMLAAIVLESQELDVRRVEEAMRVAPLFILPENLVIDIKGLKIGCIPPFAPIAGLPALVDEQIMEEKEIFGPASIEGHVIKFTPDVFYRKDVRVCKITK